MADPRFVVRCGRNSQVLADWCRCTERVPATRDGSGEASSAVADARVGRRNLALARSLRTRRYGQLDRLTCSCSRTKSRHPKRFPHDRLSVPRPCTARSWSGGGYREARGRTQGRKSISTPPPRYPNSRRKCHGICARCRATAMSHSHLVGWRTIQRSEPTLAHTIAAHTLHDPEALTNLFVNLQNTRHRQRHRQAKGNRFVDH
jgi:hypothetical protein